MKYLPGPVRVVRNKPQTPHEARIEFPNHVPLFVIEALAGIDPVIFQIQTPATALVVLCSLDDPIPRGDDRHVVPGRV